MQKCGLNENGKCLLLKVDMAENCHCPYYMIYVEHCDICGKVILEGGVFYNDKLYCADCGHKLGYCTTCRHLPNCAFETDPSPVPKVIQQTVRQGNVMASMPVKNPNRTEITCKKGCCCWDDENGCLREFNTCVKWKM